MPRKLPTLTDEQLDNMLSVLLRTGVFLAAGVVLLGGVALLLRHAGALPHYGVFHGEPANLRQVGLLFQGVSALRARAIIQLGVLLLVLTPIARVAFSAVAFARQRDAFFVAVTLFVLGVLLYILLR